MKSCLTQIVRDYTKQHVCYIKPFTAEVGAPARTWVPWKIKSDEFEIQHNFESAAEKVGY